MPVDVRRARESFERGRIEGHGTMHDATDDRQRSPSRHVSDRSFDLGDQQILPFLALFRPASIPGLDPEPNLIRSDRRRADDVPQSARQDRGAVDMQDDPRPPPLRRSDSGLLRRCDPLRRWPRSD